MKEMYQMFIKMEKEGKGGAIGGDDDENDNDENMLAVQEDNFRGAELRDLGTAELPYGVARQH